MRIRGGKNRGRELRALKSDHIRPPLERVRQVIFSILAERIAGANILDIFAGTGSLGLEALSRGAKRALFVDNSAQSVRVLKNNIASCRMEAQTQVMMMSAFQIFNSRRLREAGPYEIIFADPPYPLLDMPRGLGRFLRLLDKLVEENLLAPEGRVIARCRPGVMKLAELQQLESERSESIGDTEVFFLKQKTITKGVRPL
jgi:16S rRNA (guanine(966)-N(2))-methyltransferase RsmD